jgi:hypothetical protein
VKVKNAKEFSISTVKKNKPNLFSNEYLPNIINFFPEILTEVSSVSKADIGTRLV